MSERPSVIIDDDIYDPMTSWRESQSEQDTVSELPQPVQESESQEVTTPVQDDPAPQNSSQESEGVEVIGNGALCTCAGAASPTAAVALKVISQQRVLCNGGSLLVATDRDNTMASLNFGTCKLMNNAPCAAVITWQNPYSDINILGSLKILTMESQGICKGAAIKFETSGQSRSVSTSDITGVRAEAAQANNPLISAEGIRLENSTMEAIKAQAEEAIRKEMEEPQIVEHKEGNRQNVRVTGIIPVTYPTVKQRGSVKQPLRTSCTFRATSGGTLTWKVRNENMSVIKESTGAGEITLQFPKKGRYVIEAYRESSYVRDNTQTSDIERSPGSYKNVLIVDVSDNEIKLKTKKNKYPINIPVDITAEKLFDLSIDIRNLNYQVLETGAAVDSTVAEITPTATGANVVFKKGGTYVVHAVAANGIKITPTDGIELEKLKVTSVTANAERKYKARLKENLEFEAKLNYADANAQSVKWRVDFSRTETGSKVQKYPAPNTHISVKPSMNLFTEPGFYHIYAYINGKSESVKALVELVTPVFVAVRWKDINGNNVLEIGKRETVYANIDFEGVAGLEIQAQLCLLSTHEVLESHATRMRGTRLVSNVKLSDDTCRKLSSGSKFYWKVSCKDTSITLENKTKAPKEFPLTYTRKESITSFAFYKDKDCRESLSIATYGSTVYVRVLTRNLTGKSLEISIFRKTPGRFYGTNEIELHTSESQVNDEGFAIFKIVISNDWKNKGNDSYAIIVTEKGDRFFKEEGVSNWQTNDTAKQKFVIGKNLLFMRFVDEPTPAEGGKVLTMVAKTNQSRSKDKCPRCKVFTEAHFKEIFPSVKSLFQGGTNQLKSTTIKAFADELNKAFDEFGVDNCNRKLHFLTQIACETGDFRVLDENMNYTGTKFRNANWSKANHPKLYEDDAQSKFANNPKALANYVYQNHDKNGDEASGDGYKYRGRGLIQITKKGAYQRFENYLVKKDKVNEGTIVDNPDILLSNLSYMVRSAVWFWKYGKTSTGTETDARWDMNPLADRGNIQEITRLVHGSTHTIADRVEKHEILKKGMSLSKCQFYMNNLAKDYTIDYHIKPTIIEKHIPKGKTEDEIFQYRYFYHDESETKHFLCEVIAFEAQKWIKGTKIAQSGSDWVKVTTLQEGTRYYQKEGNNKCQLIRVPNEVVIDNLFTYRKSRTERFCANRDAFAVMLAAMGDTGYKDYYFNGFAQHSGTGYPSVSHVNGINIDIRYLKKSSPETPIYINTTGGWDVLDLDRHNIFIEKAYKRGFKQYYIMPSKTILAGQTKTGWDTMCETLATTLDKSISDVKDGIYKYGIPHEHHVHLQEFTTEYMTTIEKK